MTSANELQRSSGGGRQTIAITDLVVGTFTGIGSGRAILGATSGTVSINAPSGLASDRVSDITEGYGSL